MSRAASPVCPLPRLVFPLSRIVFPLSRHVSPLSPLVFPLCLPVFPFSRLRINDPLGSRSQSSSGRQIGKRKDGSGQGWS
jgi:hypothetical protein